MSLETSSLHQDATLWTLAGFDEYGEVTINAAVDIRVRWEHVSQTILTAEDSPVRVDAEVWVDREIEVGSIIRRGKKASVPTPATSVYRVDEYLEIPDLRAKNTEKRVLVTRFKESLPTLA